MSGLVSNRRTFLLQATATTITALADIKTSCGATRQGGLRKTSMKTYRIPHTDLVVSRIAYGCASLTDWDNNPLSAQDTARAARVVHTAHDNGITFFDHADLYAFGKSEEVFGQVLKESPGLRQKIVIQSKCGQVFPPGWQSGKPIRVDLTREHIIRAAEGSLKRLGTDYLDILLLHAPSTLVQPEEVAQAFDDLYGGGKVRYFGVSNYNAIQIQLLKKTMRQPIVANQIHLGLSFADALTDGLEFPLELTLGTGGGRYASVSGPGTLDYCRLQDIQIQAWSPVRGHVVRPEADAPSDIKVVAQRLAEVVQAKQNTPAAVVLAWLLHHPAGIVPITGATSPEHIIENCAADRVSLSNDEWYDLLAAAADVKARTLLRS